MSGLLQDVKIAVIGLGYVGLPLAVEFGKKYSTIGFDINQARVDELMAGNDSTLEVDSQALKQAKLLSYTTDVATLSSANVYIVTVPTPIDKHNQPDLSPLIGASKLLGGVIGKDDVVIFESTVYPGATEEDCIPVIETVSGLVYNKDFFAGYSPERINPGDKVNTLTKIKKVTSGSTPKIADFVDELYGSIISAGTHKATSIKVAEASKVIENVQRDVNIALINELHQIFDRLNINTKDVIDAAGTKWNFMKLMPGLVGGHCIGVDPYYLLHKSQTTGYVPDLMRQAREINNTMPSFVANNFLRTLLSKKINPVECNVLLMGFTFKENCPDIRNTKVLELYNELLMLGFNVDIYDNWADTEEAYEEYGIKLINSIEKDYDVGLLAVPHSQIVGDLNSKTINFNHGFVYDFKNALENKPS
ncbi:Vi polysaccharide biosynthesis protein VipA/TviB [Pseudoalteromonas phenolica]|uniref:Vi polysaccharide biosynthesis protein VipA/TviB n=1 Tax=Pseudoalteromonas phenolica TaxID=161398 RepID=A0A4Q7ISG3_9GAMM|nr:nucleotide sugar dehydrogenase [Pseudoalteromonas phenolica]RZQ54951.1 Vi polysaccharide biosynthesis protein VipA/TviB [Pseudoalteromonas phenolica]